MTATAPLPSEVVELPRLDELCSVSDERLLELDSEVTAARRRVDAAKLAIVAELVRRSDPALGHAGLASRLGAPTAEKAIQTLGGVSRTEAKELTVVATAIGQDSPWLAPVDSGLGDGSLSVATAAAITSGLGAPSATVAADDLLDAAHQLVDIAGSASPESMAKSARSLREALDVASISDLEEHRRSRRSLTWHQLPDGMTKLSALLDPESAAVITGAIDSITSPRRGGPRFVDPDEAARAETLVADPRTNAQLALDTLVDIVELATRAANTDIDPKTLFGSRSPAVRVHVTLEDLESGEGAAWFEGQGVTVGVGTARKHICTSGVIPIAFRGTQAVEAGATRRLHCSADRAALAAQWGGCAVPGCDRPPAMTEVHHMQAWNGRNTTLKNGIPLCRFHHHELHANKWCIVIVENPDGEIEHWWTPPPDAPPGVVAQRMEPKVPLVIRRHRENPRRVRRQ
ncbi:hypothetical protein M2152_002201 [Microbacteriaceae bacterium SG_E_30_P1]|uniref:HNH nuclease domain-containing protein n=1 Tax=Antiquaquibacter oligotrophicus TaxID=2880260 RepID=A0ABT6KS45_9MICO|nr:HNH endonuclease signature motif containing protein [Antiquaquibacter oligotrophicus]MDH6182019.1 hypothetical protein [Antiquaquibacter oligotrophicus]UDF12313.1 HNH endonuclease [Antiquaquibacter oligotrophicus]